MSIGTLGPDEFERTLAEFIRPSTPIDSFEHLVDRELQLQSAEEALASRGRHVFIYGERGVGKTSLAHTIAYKHESSAEAPVFCACGRQTDFASVIRDIVMQLAGRSQLHAQEATRSVGVQAAGLSAGFALKASQKPLAEAIDLNLAASLLHEATAGRRQRAIVVVDEFENLGNPQDRQRFAELIKQLSDRQVALALVFCGIGQSLDELLEGHGSAHRYLEGIKVPPLAFERRQAIVARAAEALGLEVDWRVLTQIANVSDGFPHYVHLIAQKMFWHAFRAPEPIREIGSAQYLEAIRAAIGSVEEHLRRRYDLAVKKDRDDYEEILWAVADRREFERHHEQVYHQSYVPIMQLRNRVPLEYKPFMGRLASLRSPAHGAILRSDRRSWVRFREDMIRGYVRMVAESKGVPLSI